ncbi:MAG: 2-amino-4-hydroxy-6-hydroxymethyldihydropteridine diphosphokinase [Planctomycetaceae bacterium]|jgi:2-amino-4-hydroxy-6-hydroxymethyldihydropteridine diphosphokinase|nr:2-amino-4-hydroxy-6-hydroxymethyldihydropteridine diphosphokinase [Planctomycetaceae bacterium]
MNHQRPANFQSVLIGLGSNLGNRAEALTCAWKLLSKIHGVVPRKISRFYETEPLVAEELPPKKMPPMYLNAAGLLETELEPFALLQTMLDIEQQLGRVRNERWGSRTIDLDLLLFGNCILRTEHLIVPHPQMTERRFVLEPAAEIAPDMQHPVVGKTILQLLKEL